MNKFSKQTPQEKKPVRESPIKKGLQGVSTLVLILCTLLCFAVVLQTALNKEVNIFGYRLFYVLTGSMEPTLPTGSLLLVREQESYEVGDIITYRAKDAAIYGMPNTHRIIAKTREDGTLWYTTQGDANPVPDIQPITDGDILGAVCFSFGSAGIFRTLLELLSTPGGFFGIVLLPLLYIAVVSMREFKKALNEELLRAAKAALEAESAYEKEHQE